jgi:2-desacetyl-2-hydroxyethyl bacteriochlorophyllide A dehydrogenase
MKEILYHNRIGRVCAPGTVDYIDADVTAPQGDEVVVAVKASAICGSDLHIFKGKHPAVPLPATIGHEFSGDVVAVGPDAGNVKAGMRVTVEPCIVCGKCDACRHGDYGYCEHISFTYRNGDGSMANYVKVKAPYVYELPADMSYEVGALIEPFSVATHAVRRADIKLGETVLVVGAGAIGILVAALCKASGAGEVVIADHNDSRLALAREMGATVTVNSGKESLEEAVMKLTGGRGVDKSFEAVGLEATFLSAMMLLKKNGLATVIGIYENPNITIPATRFITHEIKIQGAQGYCWDFPIALKMAGRIGLEKLISHTFHMDELQRALDTCMDRNAGSVKVILKP